MDIFVLESVNCNIVLILTGEAVQASRNSDASAEEQGSKAASPAAPAMNKGDADESAGAERAAVDDSVPSTGDAFAQFVARTRAISAP